MGAPGPHSRQVSHARHDADHDVSALPNACPDYDAPFVRGLQRRIGAKVADAQASFVDHLDSLDRYLRNLCRFDETSEFRTVVDESSQEKTDVSPTSLSLHQFVSEVSLADRNGGKLLATLNRGRREPVGSCTNT